MVDAVSSKSISVTSGLKEKEKDKPTLPRERSERSHSPTDSFRTLRPELCFVGRKNSTSSPDSRDFSRWHERCRPFLLETIQRRTERDIQCLDQCSDNLGEYILQQLAERNRRDYDNLSFLDLGPSIRVDIRLRRMGPRSPVDVDTESISRLSTSSQTSVNSMSSQVSDSFLNDVQQSADALLQSLRLGMAELASLERGARMSSILTRGLFRPSAFADHDKVKALKDAIYEVESIVNYYQQDIYTIGFRKFSFRVRHISFSDMRSGRCPQVERL